MLVLVKNTYVGAWALLFCNYNIFRRLFCPRRIVISFAFGLENVCGESSARHQGCKGLLPLKMMGCQAMTNGIEAGCEVYP